MKVHSVTGARTVWARVTPTTEKVGEKARPAGSCPVWPKATWAGAAEFLGFLGFGKARFGER